MQYYRQVVRLLKEKCPADMPVKVRRVKVPDDRFGDCGQMDDHYIIRICRNLKEEQAIDILIHEWAHAISWEKCNSEDHCNEWGKAYSRVYRIFVKDILNRAS
jgi:hypothetical protein